MLSARAICRLLIDDEQPVPPPADPNQLVLDFNPDELLDPEKEIMRYADKPFPVQGSGPTALYVELQNTLHGRPQKKVANNTYVIDHGDRIAVRFHRTDVVTAYPDGKVVVDSGGWRPGGGMYAAGWRDAPGRTTMDRMNGYLPSGWRIYKFKDEWYWYNIANPNRFGDEWRYPYDDGDLIDPHGSLHIQKHPLPLKPKRRRRI